jgi:hypothetical protein
VVPALGALISFLPHYTRSLKRVGPYGAQEVDAMLRVQVVAFAVTMVMTILIAIGQTQIRQTAGALEQDVRGLVQAVLR